MLFYPWLPFGLDPLDNNFPDRSCGNKSYNDSPPNPTFWGWQPFLDLVDAVLDEAHQAGLTVAEFDYGNETNVASFTVEARFLYDNKSSPPLDVLAAIRTRMANHFESGRATVSVQVSLPTTAGYNCQSFWGDSAMIFNESALTGAIAGPWGVFGMPPVSWHSGLPCMHDNPAIRYDTSNMVSLPVYHTQPTATDIHASIKVGTSDITLTAQNFYDGVWAFLVYRGLTANYAVIGETNPVEVYDCGDGFIVQRATENVAGYLGSTLYSNHAAQTMLRPWHDIKSGWCDPTPNVLKPPYGN